jgi:hypothetical protein
VPAWLPVPSEHEAIMGASEVGQEPDTQFSLPAIDDPASTEAGVFLMGLDAELLLAGLGVAAIADDYSAIALLADQARHGGAVNVGIDQLVSAGVHRWRAVRAALVAAGPRRSGSASLRHEWAQAYRALAHSEIAAGGPASVVYLTACWLRSAEIDSHAAARPGPAA